MNHNLQGQFSGTLKNKGRKVLNCFQFKKGNSDAFLNSFSFKNAEILIQKLRNRMSSNHLSNHFLVRAKDLPEGLLSN